MKIAQIAPLAESVPPKLYGGTERVVAWLVVRRAWAMRSRYSQAAIPEPRLDFFPSGPEPFALGDHAQTRMRLWLPSWKQYPIARTNSTLFTRTSTGYICPCTVERVSHSSRQCTVGWISPDCRP